MQRAPHGTWRLPIMAADVALERFSRPLTALSYLRYAGEDTGPTPTDRRKKGSKRHVITDARGVSLIPS